MRTFLLFAFTSLIMFDRAFADESLEERAVRYRDMSPWDGALATYRMSEQERQELLKAFREDYDRDAVPDSGLERILLSLRDPEIRQKYINEFIDNPASAPTLGLTRDPEILRGVARHLELDDWPTPRPESHDIVWGQPWDYARQTVLEILRNAPEFHEDVINWARRLDDQRPEEERVILREWWRANERFFLEKNYRAVRPGRDLPAPSDPPPAPDLPAQPAASVAAPPSSRAPATVERDAASPAWPIWVAAAAALAAAVVLAQRFAKPRTK